jgi:hypothetical protein
VPYLGQDTLFRRSSENLVENDPVLSQYRSNVPSLLKLKKNFEAIMLLDYEVIIKQNYNSAQVYQIITMKKLFQMRIM